MPLNPEVLDRLAAVGVDSERISSFWEKLWVSEPESFCLRFLATEEKTFAAYHLWFPKLKAYAAACRESAPIPDVLSMSTAEREQRRVLDETMRKYLVSVDAPQLAKRPNRALIISTNMPGLEVAQQHFGESDAVVLEKSEADQWFAQLSEENKWWHRRARFCVNEIRHGDPRSSDHPYGDRLRERHPILEHEKYWAVEAGAGYIHTDIWKFDGSNAEFVANYSLTICF